jgi:phenylalanyl-tRNA synthetase beta chain
MIGRRLLDKIGTGGDDAVPDGLRLANPMTPDQETLRTSLLPSLVECLSNNLRQDEAGPRLFEIGRVYLPRDADLPEERQMLAIGMAGLTWQRQWSRAAAQLDFYDLKGVVEKLLGILNLRDARFTQITSRYPFHPGRASAVYVRDTQLGVIGEIHPTVARNFEARVPIYLAEFDLGQLLSVVGEEFLRIEPLPRFPAIRRDLALIVPERGSVAELFEIIRQAGGPLLEQVDLFDLFRGEDLPAGHRSYGVGLIFRSTDQTLTDAEIVQIESSIIQQLQRQIGVRLRG